MRLRGRFGRLLLVVGLLVGILQIFTPFRQPEASRASARYLDECYPAAPEEPASAANFSHIGRVPLLPGRDGGGADVELVAKPGRPILVYQATSGGFRIIDVTDPRLPCVIGSGVSQQPAPGPVFFQRVALEKNLLALASQNNTRSQGFEGVELFDVSDPASPRLCDSVSLPAGAHSVEFDPHLRVVYATTSQNFPAAGLYVLGLSPSPESGCKNLELVARYLNPRQTDGVPPCAAMESSSHCQLVDDYWRPHDIYVPEGTDALRYVGASRGTYLVDMSSFPKMRVDWAIRRSYGPIFFDQTVVAHSHDVRLSPDRRWLVVGDERIDETCPGGGLHFYDPAAKAPPPLSGRYFANFDGPQEGSFCTSHYFEFLKERNVIVATWYAAGLWLIDADARGAWDEFSSDVGEERNTTQGKTLGHIRMRSPEVEAMEVKGPCRRADGSLEMLVYAADTRRGLDIFSYSGDFSKLPGPFQGCPGP